MTLVCENPMNYITEFCIGNGSQLETCVTTFFSHGHGHGHELLGHGHGHGHGDFPKLVTVTVTVTRDRDRDRDRDQFAGLYSGVIDIRVKIFGRLLRQLL